MPKPDKKKVLQDVHEVYDISDCIDAQTGKYFRQYNQPFQKKKGILKNCIVTTGFFFLYKTEICF